MTTTRQSHILLLAVFAVVGATSFAEPPDMISSTHYADGLPVWVSEHSAVSPEGDFRWEIFRESHRAKLLSSIDSAARLRLRKSIDSSAPEPPPRLYSPNEDVECTVFSTGSEPEYLTSMSHSSLYDLTSNAVLIVAGQVSAVMQGFFYGTPRSLLTVSNPKFLRAPDDFPASEVYIAYPHAGMFLDGDAYCAHDVSFPDRPRVGDRILVFIYVIRPGIRPPVLEPFAAGFFLERDSENVTVPVALDQDLFVTSVQRIADIEDRTGEILEEMGVVE